VAINDMQKLAIGLDNIYRVIPSTDGLFSEALRGHWENEDTLIIEDIVIGQMQRIDYRIRFSKNTVYIIGHEKYSGNRFELQGTLPKQ